MEKNLLNAWYKHFFWESSELNTRATFKRKFVQYVKDVFSIYFGEEYFVIKGPRIVSAENENWMHYLLSRKDAGAFLALCDIANLLVYSEQLDSAIQEKLFSTRHQPSQFREALFEIYVYAVLDENDIPNVKKENKKGQELEGIMTLNDTECVFECKKSLLSGVKKITTLKNLSIVFYQFFQKMSFGVEIKGYYHVKQNIQKASNALTGLLKKYNHQINQTRGQKSSFNYEDVNQELQISNYTTEEMLLIQHDKAGKDVIYFETFEPPVIVPGVENFYRIHVSYGFNIKESDVIGKLLEDISKKRKQLRKFQDAPRIIFIDNEQQKDFLLPVAPAKIPLDKARIKEYLEEKKTDDIVCLISRDYGTVPPQKSIEVFAKESLKEYCEILEKLRLV